MPKNPQTTSPPVGIILIETKPGAGTIRLPGSKAFDLAEFAQLETISIPGRVILSDGQSVRVGRDSSNEMMLDIQNVSRFHAMFTVANAAIRVSDLSSTNGTFLNGNPVTAPTKVGSGDVVEIGPVKLKVELLSDLSTQTNLSMVGTAFDPISVSGIVTVLVADICGYTKMSETLPPEDLTKTLQRWFERVTHIIQEHGGKVDKYIGDCVMAFWKCTDRTVKLRTHEAAKAALAVKKATQQLSESEHWRHRDYYDWDCRISLNTGQVMMGTVGGRGSRDFTVLGDVVNVAFRLNSVAGSRGYDFVLGDSTANYIQDKFSVVKLGPIEVKGRNQKVVAYTLAEVG